MSKRTGSTGLGCRLRLEQLEGRLAPAAHLPEQMVNDGPSPVVVADTRVVEMGPMDMATMRPLLAAVVAVGACVAWDRRANRPSHASHQGVK